MSNSALVFALSALKKANTANERIDNLPLPMVFKGTLGTGGTIETLPAASSDNVGFVYIVITDGTYAGQTAKAGDLFVSDGATWVIVPSADDPFVISSFTYVGDGNTSVEITFPVIPKLIIAIEGSTTSYFCRTINILWGITSRNLTSTISSTFGAANYGSGYSFDNNNKKLTIESGSALASLNFSGSTYTVYYI